MMPKQVTPLSSKRHLIGIALVLLALVIVITSLIAIGFFDPKPIGSLALHQKLNQTVQVVDEIQMALIETPVRDKFSVRLVAALKSGDADIGYGLKIGAPGSSVIVAVSPLGYVTIKNDTDIGDAAHDAGRAVGDSQFQIPWQTWPHVAEGMENNEIWIDVEDSKLVSARINRELLWNGSIPLDSKSLHFWAESYAEPALVDLKSIELYTESLE